MDDALDRKLADPRLRALADQSSPDVVNVLIEVDLPAPRFTLTRRPGAGAGDRRVGAARPQMRSSGEAPSTARKDEAARFLARLLGSVPRWLPAAHAFVADVTGAQLVEIARSPLTRSVAVNRSLGGPGV
jgi:hypothetical protein